MSSMLVLSNNSSKVSKGNIYSNVITGNERMKQIQSEIESEKESRDAIKNSPYTKDGFLQQSMKHVDKFIWLEIHHGHARGILTILENAADGLNEVSCSYEYLCKATGLSESSVTRALRILSENGFIYSYRTGRANTYIVNPELYWKSYGYNYKNHKFPINLALSTKELEAKNKGIKQLAETHDKLWGTNYAQEIEQQMTEQYCND